MEMTPLILIILGVSGGYCDSHSLRYYSTSVSSPGSGLPVYSEVGYVDDKEIANYNIDTRQSLPKTEWMKKVGSDYWERNTQIGRSNEAGGKHSIQTAMRRFNQTGGIHILQDMYGCELRDDGTTEGYQQYGYDGRDFMSLDTQRGIWIPTMNEAQYTTQRWNSPEMRQGERNKNYLENECIEWLKKHINNGREDLEKRVRPEVKVWGHRQSDGVTRLQCLVYGFHPRPVDVKWVRNGEDDVPSDEMTPILPHPDGTYQIRVSVEVPTREGDTYSCHVDHSSLEDETLSVIWDPNANSKDNMPIIIGVVVMLIVASVIGFLIYRKRCTGKKPANPNTYVQAPIMAPANPNTYVPAPSNDGNSSTVTHPTAECNDGNSSTVTHPTAEYSHSLRYYSTAVSSPGSGLPVYSEVGYVDDKEIANYNSDTRQDLPKTEWMKKLGSDYWEENTQLGRNNEAGGKRRVQTAMRRFNQTGGIHIVQWMSGCELRDDGTTEGYFQYGYDGRDFMSLDTQRWIYIPTMNEAQITTQRWNSPEMREGEIRKNYLENECIEWLKKHINNGREDLEKRVPPEVKVWGHRQLDDVTRLQCLVYGFHPRPVDVKWVRNGEDDVPSDEMTPILPHPDGTYQIRVSVEVPTREGDTYSCHVDHSSLGDETLSVIWDPNANSKDNKPLIIGVVAVAVMLIVAVIAFLIYRRSSSGKKPANPNTYVPAPMMAPANPNTYVPAPSYLMQKVSQCTFSDHKQGNITFGTEFSLNRQVILNYDNENETFVPCPFGCIEEMETVAEKIAALLNTNPDTVTLVKKEEERCKEEVKTFWDKMVERKVKPSVEVFLPVQVHPDSLPVLICHVWGFYPPDITVAWFKNGKLVKKCTEAVRTGDWTYRIVVALDLEDSLHEDNYTCLVNHRSLDIPIVKNWKHGLTNIQIIKISVASVVFALGLVFLITEIACWRNAKRSGYSPIAEFNYFN